MDVVREMRSWQGSPANLAAMLAALKTHLERRHLLCLYFSSRRFSTDIVNDCCPDIMHAWLAGMSRYMLSWLTDVLIPRYFSWNNLNAPSMHLSVPISHSGAMRKCLTLSAPW